MGTLNFNVSALIRTHYFDSRFVSLWKVVQTTQYSRRLLSIAITNKNIIYLSVWTWRIAFSCTWFSFPSTRTTNSVRLSSARNILFARITSNEPVCFEGWNKSDPPENQIWHTAVASLASQAGVFRGARISSLSPKNACVGGYCQLGQLSINFDFRKVIFQSMVFPFVWAKYKWNFMRDRCKLSFPLPLAAWPLARAFLWDSLHSPK